MFTYSNIEHYSDPNWSKNGFSMMEEIRRMGKLCDITLVANDHKFTAHRIVLASSIPYFHAMFLHDMMESKQDVITINNIDSNALEQFINYSYNGNITINNENVQSLLIAANFFHLQNVKNACSDFIKKRLNITDALCVRQFAEQFMCRDLISSVNRFINKHFSKICQTEEFLNLTFDDLTDFLSRDQLNINCEEQAYNALILWIKHDEKNRLNNLCDLLKLIRLPLIAPTYLVDVIANERLIKNNIESRDLLDEAIYYYLLPERRNQFKTFNLKPRCCNDSFGLIYAIGGLNSNGGSISTVEVYDCIQDKWRLAESMITNRSRVAVAVLQGKLYAIGGYCQERLAIVEVFEPELKKWKRVSSISKPKSALGSAVLNNKLYVCGGYNGVQSSDTVEMYNPANDQWTMVSSMKKHRSAAGVTAFNGMIFVAGGHDGYRIFDSVECYDTQKDCWTMIASMNNKRCRLGLSALNGFLYAAGGYDSINFLNTVECYNLGDDKWTYAASMNVKRSRMGLVTCNSRLYAIGGYDGVCNLSSVEYYDADTNQWTMCAPMVAHEGVVGVGVLPIEVDIDSSPNEQETKANPFVRKDNGSISSVGSCCSGSSNCQNNNLNSNSNSNDVRVLPVPQANNLYQNKPFMNYYSLIEDEEDEDQYRNNAILQQRQLQSQNQQPR